MRQGCSIYTETEHPLLTNNDSDKVRIKRLHQRMRKLIGFTDDDIICYLHDDFFVNGMGADVDSHVPKMTKITKYHFTSQNVLLIYEILAQFYLLPSECTSTFFSRYSRVNSFRLRLRHGITSISRAQARQP